MSVQTTRAVEIVALVTSGEHNYVGHFGGPSGTCPATSTTHVTLIPTRGIAGDRYVEREAGHPKQITFFEAETLGDLSTFAGREIPPSVVRRNVFTHGIVLNDLVGKRFRIQGAVFEGTQHCHPCFWMNEAIGPGAEEFLKMRGGLRARILEGEALTVGPAAFELLDAEAP